MIAISSQCPFCRESIPLYRRLLAAADGQKAAFRLCLVAQEDPRSVQDFLEVDSAVHIMEAPLESLGVTGTPTLLVADQDGVIDQAFIGRISPNREKQLMKVLSRGR